MVTGRPGAARRRSRDVGSIIRRNGPGPGGPHAGGSDGRSRHADAVAAVPLVGNRAGARGRLRPRHGALLRPGAAPADRPVVARGGPGARAPPDLRLGRHVRARDRAVLPAPPARLPAPLSAPGARGGHADGRRTRPARPLPAARNPGRAGAVEHRHAARAGALRSARASRSGDGGLGTPRGGGQGAAAAHPDRPGGRAAVRTVLRGRAAARADTQRRRARLGRPHPTRARPV